MPFRKRPLREQMQMARDLVRLQRFERTARSEYAGTTIATSSLPNHPEVAGAVDAALSLAHQVRVTRANNGKLVFRAVRFEG